MRLLIVDDHAILREGLTALLQQFGPDTEVLNAADGTEALALVDANPNLDVVILDLAMPGMEGGRVIERLGAMRPDLPAIVLSASESAADVRRVLALGALGYVPKSANPNTLLSAIKLVLAGEIYVPPLMLEPQGDSSAPTGLSSVHLTQRQRDVLNCMSRGLSNKRIAQELGLAEKTVKAHITVVLRVLGASNRTHAVTIARENGLAP